MLTMLAAFLISNVLTVWYGFPGATAVFSGGGVPAFIQLALFLIAIGLAVFHVMRAPDTGLRWEARRISDFNAYLIRGFFFAVLLVGLADAAIAFMRVEKFLDVYFGAEMTKNLTRAVYVGTWVHTPLILVGFVIALFSRTLGFHWLALLIVAAELGIVISRFVFSYEQALMGDLVRYWYAALFLFASAYTLLQEGHVRVDVFYAAFARTKKGFVNAIGTVLLGITTSWVILAIGLNGKQAIVNSPVKNFEVSQAGVSGMYTKYHMAAFLGIFALTMLIQFVAYLFEAVADRRDEPGHVSHENVAH